MFFATFWGWLNAALATYIGASTARVAAVLEPAIITLGTIYVMFWGFLQLTGRIEEPFLAGLKRIALLALVFGIGLHLWLYNTVIVDTFYKAPVELAAGIVGAGDPVSTVDAIWNEGGAVADQLYHDGGLTGLGFIIAGFFVWVVVGLLCVYTMFLLALSSIALSVLLALGPLFIGLLLFGGTRRFFESWIAQLANYALVTVLTVMVSALLLHIVATYATQTAALGTALDTVDVLNLLLVTVLVLLFMRQVMPIAAALAGGVSLSTFGTLSRTAAWSAAALAGGGSSTAIALARTAARGARRPKEKTA